MLKQILPLTLILFFGFTPHTSRSVSDGPQAPTHSSDGPVPATIGFFMDNWRPKTFIAPPSISRPATTTPAPATATLTIDADSVLTRILPSEFGHNAVTWMGAVTNQPTVVTNLTNLHPNIIRWPAGSGSDGYFWNCAPGHLTRDVPVFLIDENGKKKFAQYFYGRSADPRVASLDDYYDMLKKTGNQGLITVNYGYARYGRSENPVATAAHLAADWVRYDHGRTKYWEIGNENYGTWELGFRIDTAVNKDGQPEFLSGELYGRHFMIFADSMRKAAAETGAVIYIGAVTHEAAPMPWDGPCTRNWNAGVMKAAHDHPDFYVVHNYFTPYNMNSNATDILHTAVATPEKMIGYIRQCLQESGAALKPVVMDEWNMFAVGSHQQVSNISGLFAVIVLGETIRSKYGLACRWDLFNGWAGGNDHGLFSAGDEPGVQRWSPRPSFYYLYYLQRCLGDRLVDTRITGDTSIRAYASTFSSGELGAALVNTSATATAVKLDLKHFVPGRRYYWYTLQGGDDNGEFSAKVTVNGEGPTGSAGGPDNYAAIKANAAAATNHIGVTVPAHGAVFLVIDSRR